MVVQGSSCAGSEGMKKELTRCAPPKAPIHECILAEGPDGPVPPGRWNGARLHSVMKNS